MFTDATGAAFTLHTVVGMMMKACRPAALLLAVLSGCVDPGSGNGGAGEGGAGGKADDETSASDRTLSASWSIQDLATSSVVACPQGFDSVALQTQRIKADGSAVGDPTIDLYDCADGSGDATLEAGRYRVTLSIVSHDGADIYASSTEAVVDLGETDQAAAFSIVRDGGYFSLAWNLVGETSGDPLDCDDVTALAGVEMIATLAGSTDATSDIWDCVDGVGTTAALPAGMYTVSVDALDETNAALGTAPTLADREIKPLNQVTHLGTVTIPITGR